MSQNGKGSKPRPVKGEVYRSNFDDIMRCDICGRFVSYIDIEKGAAVREMTVPDNAFGGEEWETYHLACHKA